VDKLDIHMHGNSELLDTDEWRGSRKIQERLYIDTVTSSSYLIILCQEAHIVLLKRAEARRDIYGVKVYGGVPLLTHLLFVKDLFYYFAW